MQSQRSTAVPTGMFPAAGASLVLLLSALLGCHEEQLNPSQPPSGPSATVAASAAGKPNIVVVMTDDQTVENMRAMPQVRSLIGDAGMTFDNNVVTYAICCPSRATFLTGQYTHNHGVRSNAAPEGGYTKLDHNNTLPLWLQQAGYVTGNIGKYLNGYGKVDSTEVPPGWTEWYGAIGNSADKYFNYYMSENGRVVFYAKSPEEYKSDVFTNMALDFIRRRAPGAAAGGAPFFLWISYHAPHWGNPVEPGDPTSIQTPVPAPRHKGRFAGLLLPPSPAFNEANMSDKPASMRSRPLLTTTVKNALQEAYRQRLESLLSVDEGVASIMAALQDGGVLDNTMVIFTSDNGFFQGEHRIEFGKILPYEPAVKVPLLIRGPGVLPGRRNTAAVANIDLAPTIVDVAGATPGLTMDGRSLLPMLGGQAAWFSESGQRHILVEDSKVGTLPTIFLSIRRGQYVYTEYANGDRELYNLRADSAQLTSRHADPAMATIRRQLATRMAAIKACVGPTACW